MPRPITSLCPWWDDRKQVIAYVLRLVKDGVLRIDPDGRVWRRAVMAKAGWKPIKARRAETKTKRGYLAFVFRVPGANRNRHVLAHILVWNWANGPVPDGLQINHKDTDKTNNRLDNLEVVTGSENMLHSYANGRTRPHSRSTEWRPGVPRISPEKMARLVARKRQGMSVKAICESEKVSRTHLCRILKREGGDR